MGRALLVDNNGWHALLGFALAGPAFVAAIRPRWALRYAIFLAVAIVLSGIYIYFDNDVFGLIPFGDRVNRDVAYHVVLGVTFGLVAFAGAQRPPFRRGGCRHPDGPWRHAFGFSIRATVQPQYRRGRCGRAERSPLQ